MRAALTAIALAAGAAAAGGAELEAVAVGHARGDFTLHAVMRIAAPLPAVRAALTDFDRLGALSPSILESRVVRVEGDATLVFTRSRACAGWFCRQVRKTERVTLAGDEIRAELASGPGLEPANLEHSLTTWRLEARDGATRVTLDSAMDPRFMVPPLVGPPLVKSALKREAKRLADGLERAAQARAAERGDGG